MKLFRYSFLFLWGILFFISTAALFSCGGKLEPSQTYGLDGSFSKSDNTTAADLKKISLCCWNTQTFFDAVCDGTEYTEFQSEEKWTKEKYSKRLDSLCEVMTTLNPDIMVLEEIESEAVVQDICNKLASTSWDKKKSWQYTCFAKEPGTAIGSAVFSRLELKDLIVHSLDVRVHEEKQPSERPLMEVSVNCQNKLFKLFVCHWKSKSGGEVETEIWRDWQESLLSQRLQKCECAGIPAIVCGDFNRNAEDFIVLSKKEKDYNIVLRGAEKKSVAVYCPWISSEGNVKKEKGSYFYKNEWERIDNIFSFGDIMLTKFQAVTIPPLADDEGKPVPYKMYNESGFSDHLPLKCIILI